MIIVVAQVLPFMNVRMLRREKLERKHLWITNLGVTVEAVQNVTQWVAISTGMFAQRSSSKKGDMGACIYGMPTLYGSLLSRTYNT